MNYKKNYSCFVIAITLLGTTSFAQRLVIGDQLPNIQLGNVINHSSTTLDLGSISKKLIILNFWATTCYSCIDEFPRLDSLQKEFGDKIQIIAINPESEDSILSFFTRFKKLRIPSIPFVTGDTILAKHFPHRGVPYHVWVDSTKKINFKTFGWNANNNTVNDYLRGKQLDLTKIPYAENSFIETPLVDPLNKEVEFYSLLSKSIPGISMGNSISHTDSEGYPNRITFNSASILRLLIDAYSEGGKYNFDTKNTVIFANLKRADVDYPSDITLFDEWLKNNSYNYDIQVPVEKSKNIYKNMQRDLYRYFGLEGNVQMKRVDCWVIIRTGKSDKLKSKGKLSKYIHNGMHRDTLWYYHDVSMKTFANRLQQSLLLKGLSVPIVDRTNYQHHVDIGLRSYADQDISLECLRNDLKKYELDIIQKKIPVPTLVLRKINQN